MNKVIIIAGLPGTGKTTLAAELARRTGLVCIHKDTLKEEMHRALDSSVVDYNKMIGKLSMELLYSLAEEQLGRGVNLIIEAPFYYQQDYPHINAWLGKYNCEIYTIICSIGKEERTRRKTERSRDAAHHPHESGNEQAYEQIPGKRLYLQTDQPVEPLIDRAIGFIFSEKQNRPHHAP
ncbi:AAA family ATPase [Candidatus Uhrbacteria bacterium]|nr:AAA family ATPase [Candidatus Uhrbacteria bacterium]